MRAPVDVDVLVPTKDRPVELAATLAGLAAQAGTGGPSFRVVVSDQSGPDDGGAAPDDGGASFDTASAAAMVRVLRHRGVPVELHRHLPRRGIAEQRAFLLSCARADAVLFLDDDVWLEPGGVACTARISTSG